MPARVLNIETRRIASSDSETAFRLRGTQLDPIPASAMVMRDVGGSAAAAAPALIEIDRLYPAAPGTQTDLIRALGLLADAVQLLEQARRQQSALEADRFVQRVQQLLVSLFSCRKIGDGFGAVINALHFAFVNQHGTPFSRQEIDTMWRILKDLRTRPYLSFTDALDSIVELEESGLTVDAPGLADILDDSEDA